MEETSNIQATEYAPPTPAESTPAEESKQSNVYGQPGAGAYTDSARALAGSFQQQAQPAQDLDTAPPPGQRFGLSEARKQQIAAEMKVQKGQQVAVAVAAAPAKATRPAVDPVALVGDYFTREEADHGDLLGRLYDADYDSYQGLIDHVISSNRDYALRLLGENVGPRATDPEFAHLPEKLRQVAADMRPDIFAQLSYASPAEQEYHLQRELQLQEAQRAEWERSEAQHQQVLQDVERSGWELVSRASNHYRDQHLQSLKDFKPHGTPYENENVCNVMMHAAQQEMRLDSRFAKMEREALQLALEIPHLVALGKPEDAAAAEGHMHELAEQWNKEFARYLKHYRDQYAAMAEKARRWDEYEASQKEKEGRPVNPMGDLELGDQIPGTRFHYRKR